MDRAQILFGDFATRHTYKQKSEFLEFARKEFQNMGYDCALNRGYTLGIESNNLVIGSVHHANRIIIAHYDTPKTSFLPIVLFPLNRLLSLIFVALPYIILLFLIKILFWKLQIGMTYEVTVFFLLLFMLAFSCNNRININDNSAGVLALFEIAKMHPPDVAFVLIDHHHLGRQGIAQLQRTYGNILNTKLFISLDGVGSGDFLCIKHSNRTDKFVESIEKNLRVSYKNKPQKGLFEKHIQLQACKKTKIGYCLPNTHSLKDTVFHEDFFEEVIRALIYSL